MKKVIKMEFELVVFFRGEAWNTREGGGVLMSSTAVVI